ncbi:hypothetical protein F511_33764 [Dorcoceras hygrometricum]|uniref:Uncharacterized protein n=1 Tax=Dorcoceras hygrometricum TaxID=472368 RepID=A0A2Z7D9Y5_9LAMI|nr:hypothetical protein F511_33764 [Dorcoceras hygrometricum]
MRIRPPEFETSICDAKYHVSLIESTIKFWNWPPAAAACGGPLLVRISRAHLLARVACAGRRLAQDVAQVVAQGGHECAADCGSLLRAGHDSRPRASRNRCATWPALDRALAARFSHAGRRRASLCAATGRTRGGRTLRRRRAAAVSIVRRWLADERRCWRGHASRLARRRARLPCDFSCGAAAGRPPIRRCSGDVVTADFF